MSEVYPARDTKFNRDVARKFVSETFTLDGDRVGRLRRASEGLH